jgi:hypothetical protein
VLKLCDVIRGRAFLVGGLLLNELKILLKAHLLLPQLGLCVL